MAADFTHYSEIRKLEFYVLGSEENYVDSAADVTNKELFKGELPVVGGVYDAAFGSTSLSYLCSTCLQPKGKCSGHSGAVTMRYPVKNPLFRESILKWLKIICFKCGLPLVDKNIEVASSRLLIEYVKLAKTIDKCPHCDEPHPTVIKDKYEQSKFIVEYKSGKYARREELFNNQIKQILEKISDETVLKLHKPLMSHPRNFIINIVRVPPNTIRPDIRKIGGSRSNNNDITALTKKIVELNDALPIKIPEVNEISKELRELYFTLDMTYFEMIKGSSSANNQVRMTTATNKAPSSIASRLPKKTGRIRKNLMGKRTRYMIRSVDVIADNRWLLYRVFNLL